MLCIVSWLGTRGLCIKDSKALNVYGFINPIHVSIAGFVNNVEKRVQRVRYSIDGLKGAGQNDIICMPYSPG
ncbi:hypothetical protein QYF36_019845 [Acer negundo]|nr:hypothetical protein QYF36_019845 [Acer negundo]